MRFFSGKRELVGVLSKKVILLLFLVLSFFCVSASYANELNPISVDLTKNKILFTNFPLGNLNISGRCYFKIDNFLTDSFTLVLEGRNFTINEKRIPWVKLKITKIKDFIYLHYLKVPQGVLKGNINLANKELSLELEVNGIWESLFLRRLINTPEGFLNTNLRGMACAKAKIWGPIKNPNTAGILCLKNGRYKETEFSELNLMFLGKPPLLELTDSFVVLLDGSIYSINGILDLHDELISNAEFISRKVKIGGWQLLSERRKNVGLKTNLNDKFDLLLDTYDKNDTSMSAGAELRYKMPDNNFLRLRVQQDKAIVGFEKRQEF